MSIIEVLLIAISLALDAFAVSVSKGLLMEKMDWRKALICGLYFGAFQFMMPVIGFYLGYGFRDLIVDVDHWIAFGLLTIIGISMIRESKKEDELKSGFGPSVMIPLAIATSIDALAVGVSFAILKVDIIVYALIIGIIAFTMSTVGVRLGRSLGTAFKAKASIAGGVILIIIGTRILLEHLGVLSL